MNRSLHILAQVVSALIIILSLITVAHANLPVNTNPRDSAQTDQTKLRMLFAGRAHNAVIYPFAHQSDLFLINIKNIEDMVVFSESPAHVVDDVTTSELVDHLWQQEMLNACIIGTFHINNNREPKSYVFELSNPSYNNKTKTFSVHAKSLGSKNLPAFSTKKPMEVTEVAFFIDPIVLGNTFHGF